MDSHLSSGGWRIAGLPRDVLVISCRSLRRGWSDVILECHHPMPADQLAATMTDITEKSTTTGGNHVMQGLWVGGPLPIMAQLCIRSFLANGHAFHLYAYHDVGNVPSATDVMDGREFVPESRIFRKSEGFGGGSLAPFSDYFRYQLLWERGGWWVDMDLVCLKPFDFPESHILATRWERTDAQSVVGCAMKFPPGDAMIRYCLEACEGRDLASLRYGRVGPDLLAEAVREFDARWLTAHWGAFCPIGYREAASLTLPPSQRSLRRIRSFLRRRPDARLRSDSFAVHLWHEMWRNMKLDTEATYHPRSYFEQLKSLYLEDTDSRINRSAECSPDKAPARSYAIRSRSAP